MSTSPERINGVVETFNAQKGWGWVRLPDGRQALLHVQALRKSGLQSIEPGAAVVCMALQRPKSLQIFEVVQCNPRGQA